MEDQAEQLYGTDLHWACFPDPHWSSSRRSMKWRASLDAKSLILTGQRSRAMVFVVHIKKFDITEIIGHSPILYDSIPNPLRNAIDLRATSQQRSHSRIWMPLIPLKERLSASNNGPF